MPGLLALLALLAAPTNSGFAAPGPEVVRVFVRTTEGPLTLEVDPWRAPGVVERFLSLARRSGEPREPGAVRGYGGSELCRLRVHEHLTFGCLPRRTPHFGNEPVPSGPPWPDEVDGAALGLADRLIEDPRELDWLWQEEIFPRWHALRGRGDPIPDGLALLRARIDEEGTAGTAFLRGRSRLWYLEALGYRYREGRSSLPFDRGALATAADWPGEADARFMIGLARLPARDGRSTVFGRLVEGWDTVEAIRRLRTDKSLRPVDDFRILSMRVEPYDDEGDTP